jgi:hypothetical protein
MYLTEGKLMKTVVVLNSSFRVVFYSTGTITSKTKNSRDLYRQWKRVKQLVAEFISDSHSNKAPVYA